MTTISSSVTKFCVTDFLAFLLVYFVPTLSHMVSFPLYLVDPMRIVVLGALLCTRNWKNTLFLAISLPIFSFLVSAHPVFPKCLLIAGELAVNVLLFTAISKNFTKYIGISAFTSIVISKVVYYAVKSVMIWIGLLSISLIGTNIMIQILVAAIISIVFSLLYYKSKK